MKNVRFNMQHRDHALVSLNHNLKSFPEAEKLLTSFGTDNNLLT